MTVVSVLGPSNKITQLTEMNTKQHEKTKEMNTSEKFQVVELL
jgi:hypothetical protein